MESECEGCGEKSGPLGGTWHNLCFACVGKLKAENERLKGIETAAHNYINTPSGPRSLIRYYAAKKELVASLKEKGDE